MYKRSTNNKRILYSEQMFEVLTTFYNMVKGDDTNQSQRTIIEDRDREVKRLTNDERDNEESEDEETLATIVRKRIIKTTMISVRKTRQILQTSQ